MPLFFLSYFKAPKGVSKEIIKLQRNFLRGWGSEGRKNAWIGWENICKPKEDGGLGIKSIDIFNNALLEKWLWRLRSPEHGLWKVALESKYGSWGTANSVTPTQNGYKSRWWDDLSKVSLSDQGSSWFVPNLVWQVGSGKKFKFWEDEWFDNSQLKERYPRIYNNSRLKDNPIGRFGS